MRREPRECREPRRADVVLDLPDPGSAEIVLVRLSWAKNNLGVLWVCTLILFFSIFLSLKHGHAYVFFISLSVLSFESFSM